MKPLQLQKQLRLREARRTLLGENLDDASAGYRVGYDDASQLSREYKRLFGQPPRGTWSGCAWRRGDRPASRSGRHLEGSRHGEGEWYHGRALEV